MIREAVETDIPALVEMGRNFHAGMSHSRIGGFDQDSATDTLRRLIEAEDACLFIAPGGMGAATLERPYFNRALRILQELWVWVEPDARGSGTGPELYRRMEGWGRLREASHMLVMSNPDQRPEATARLYRRMGFEPVEMLFMKGL